MSEANAKTLTTYNHGVDEYIFGTVQETSGQQMEWLDFVFENTPKDAKVLEIGSAFGRDAAYLIKKGYNLDLTDGSVGFVNYLNSHGFYAEYLDIVTDAPKKQYDIILACAVFLHFTDDDFKQAIVHVKQVLTEGGKLAFSVKHGDGDAWSDDKMGSPRYFRYWRREELETVLSGLGMSIIDLKILNNDKWLHVVCEDSR